MIRKPTLCQFVTPTSTRKQTVQDQFPFLRKLKFVLKPEIMAKCSPKELKTAISTIDKPIVLRDFQLDWHVHRIDFEEWCDEMDKHNESKPVPFSGGTTKHCDSPYWERLRTIEYLTFNQFLKNSKSDSKKDRWHSHSYKDITSWPESLKSTISFEKLGFGEDITKDVLFWLGSAGANTPCHYDTYGFNIVVQVFGQKQWLLFSPSTKLTATRVPYEESSVYCKQNFYSPSDMDQFDVIRDCDSVYEVIVNPGDILIIPPNYWHYVENLETSLAVNTWIPLEKHDSLARLGECFVRIQVDKLTEDNEKGSRDDLRRYIYNPNEIDTMADMNLFNLFKPLADIVLEFDNSLDCSEKDREAGQLIRDNALAGIFRKINPITKQRFNEILMKNSLRYDIAMEDRKSIDPHFIDVENVINAICHPQSVANACQIFIQQVGNENK